MRDDPDNEEATLSEEPKGMHSLTSDVALKRLPTPLIMEAMVSDTSVKKVIIRCPIKFLLMYILHPPHSAKSILAGGRTYLEPSYFNIKTKIPTNVRNSPLARAD